MIRAKFVALRPFAVSGRTFDVGDPVDGLALRAALRLGDEFVAANTSRRRKAAETTPAPIAADDTDQEVAS